MLSKEEYDAQLETLHFMSDSGLKDSIQQADKDIERGDTFSIDEVL